MADGRRLFRGRNPAVSAFGRVAIFRVESKLRFALLFGALAQLARAPHWQCGGHRFESDMLHHFFLSPFPPVRVSSRVLPASISDSKVRSVQGETAAWN